jgi:hypothetical protein
MAEQFNQMSGEIMKEMARRMVKRGDLTSPPPGISIDDMTFRDNDSAARSVSTAADMHVLISDLRLKLLIAPEGREFISSDHPVVITNQRFERTGSQGISGLAMKGVQIFLPVHPSACLIFYDSKCYRVGVRRKEIFNVLNSDIEYINALQILNADAVIYFHSESVASDALALRLKFMRPIAAPVVQKFTNPKGGLLVMFKKEDVPKPGPWSFCKVIKGAPDHFGPRDSEIHRLFNQYGREQERSRSKTFVPFSQWLQQNVLD